jgi:hypothetical protein
MMRRKDILFLQKYVRTPFVQVPFTILFVLLFIALLSGLIWFCKPWVLGG